VESADIPPSNAPNPFLKMKLSEIPTTLSLAVVRDGEFDSLGKARHTLPQMLTFLESIKYLSEVISNSYISCIITTKEIADQVPTKLSVAISTSPRKVFSDLHNYLATETDFYWKPFESIVDPTARIHPRAIIADQNVKIGRGVVIEAGAVVCEKCIIGEDVIIRSGTVVGGEGFEYHMVNGRQQRVVHAGGVYLGDRVDIHCNCTIDRSIFGDMTVIGSDTKIDNHVHIAHRVKIGENCLIVAGAIISGNVTIGNGVWIGPNATITNGITIGDNAKVTLGSVVVCDTQEKKCVTGNFAVEHSEFLETMALNRARRNGAIRK